ncbi:hypothetical protein AGMMS50296_0630 [Alphaproteobacteria bacterium]|nr:hypothetical protein AGMMS50296_0630 [Alphaproteobacteria bacterium]
MSFKRIFLIALAGTVSCGNASKKVGSTETESLGESSKSVLKQEAYGTEKEIVLEEKLRESDTAKFCEGSPDPSEKGSSGSSSDETIQISKIAYFLQKERVEILEEECREMNQRIKDLNQEALACENVMLFHENKENAEERTIWIAFYDKLVDENIELVQKNSALTNRVKDLRAQLKNMAKTSEGVDEGDPPQKEVLGEIPGAQKRNKLTTHGHSSAEAANKKSASEELYEGSHVPLWNWGKGMWRKGSIQISKSEYFERKERTQRLEKERGELHQRIKDLSKNTLAIENVLLLHEQRDLIEENTVWLECYEELSDRNVALAKENSALENRIKTLQAQLKDKEDK